MKSEVIHLRGAIHQASEINYFSGAGDCLGAANNL